MVILEQQDTRVSKAREVLVVLQEQLDALVHKDRWDQEDHKGNEESLEQLD